MPKIKLKPNLYGVEIGIGNTIRFKMISDESVEVNEELLGPLSGQFDLADEEIGIGIGPPDLGVLEE
jgi:hypothetical protein